MILVTGGLGYIGSHICLELLKQDKEFCIVDNLSNGHMSVVNYLENISGKKVNFNLVDMKNYNELRKVFMFNDIDYVIHLAGYKSVIESIEEPEKYYTNNIVSTLNLLRCVEEFNCNKLVFSSSASVYGNAEPPITENTNTNPMNPYAKSKLIIEDILNDYYKHKNFKIVILRYFNPIGSEENGFLGDVPNDNCCNVMSYLIKTALGQEEIFNREFGINFNLEENTILKTQKIFKIYGDKFETKDGTAIRDFVHVVDLAKVHINALEQTDMSIDGLYEIYNIGTSNGFTIKELLDTFQKVNDIKIPYEIVKEREGEIPISCASTTKAELLLNWNPKKTLEDMCRDSYKFMINYIKYEGKDYKDYGRTEDC